MGYFSRYITGWITSHFKTQKYNRSLSLPLENRFTVSISNTYTNYYSPPKSRACIFQNGMALGKRCGSFNENCGGATTTFEEVKFVRSYSFGRKRVFIPSNGDVESFLGAQNIPLKRMCSANMMSDFVQECHRSLLESLPQDVLVRILSCVDHDDLKQLFHVSKAIREATLIAKQLHFAYSTPKKIQAFRKPIDLAERVNQYDEMEAPNAPKHSRRVCRSHLNLADVSVSLFGSPRKELFIET